VASALPAHQRPLPEGAEAVSDEPA